MSLICFCQELLRLSSEFDCLTCQVLGSIYDSNSFGIILDQCPYEFVVADNEHSSNVLRAC